MTTAVVIGLGAAALAHRHGRVSGSTVSMVPLFALLAAVAGVPAALAAATAVAALGGRRRLARSRAGSATADADVAVLGELVLLGVGAGLTFVGALELAAAEVDPRLREEVEGVVRRVRRSGTAAVLEEAGGRARRLYLLAGRAALTGAPIADAVAAFVSARHDEERARRKAVGARLPVRLLVPLSLLILPGFIVLTVGPALLGALHRLGLIGP